MKLMVLGAAGMMGRALMRELEARHEIQGFDLDDFDLRDQAEFIKRLERQDPSAVINCAAGTAVDRAEEEPDLVMEINAHVPGRIAAACRERGIRFVHLSTDYVFDGKLDRPYREDDPAGPLNVYGKSKLLSEELVRQAHPEGHLIFRTSWLFGEGGQNFVRTMLERFEAGQREFRVVADQRGRPTYAPDLSRLIRLSLEKGLLGLYHACNAGEVSWFELARRVFERAGVIDEVKLVPVKSDEYPLPARRPKNSALDTGRLERALGVEMNSLDRALSAYLQNWRRGVR